MNEEMPVTPETSQTSQTPETPDAPGTPEVPPKKRRTVGAVLFDYVEMFAWSVFAVLLIFTFGFRLCQVDGQSMENSLHNGERLLLFSAGYTPRQDDIVVFHSGFSSTMANYSHGKDTRDYYLIHWVTRGRGTYQTETAKYSLREGDGFLILPGQTIVHTADKELLEKILSLKNIKSGNFGTGDIFLSDPVKKNLFREKFKICAFDMETAAIACVCDRCRVPFLSLRKISDDADDSSVSDYREMNEKAESHLTDILFDFFKIL